MDKLLTLWYYKYTKNGGTKMHKIFKFLIIFIVIISITINFSYCVDVNETNDLNVQNSEEETPQNIEPVSDDFRNICIFNYN